MFNGNGRLYVFMDFPQVMAAYSYAKRGSFYRLTGPYLRKRYVAVVKSSHLGLGGVCRRLLLGRL